MKRITALAVLALVVLTACTPAQGARWLADWIGASPEKQAMMIQAKEGYEATKAEATAGLHCEEWYDFAIEAGFTPEQWKEPVARVMWRESMCNPNADNSSSTADGLMQIVRGTWLSSCPDLPYAMRYDPQTNLDCAYRVSGGGHYWRPWVTY
jgi:hypothetical protein